MQKVCEIFSEDSFFKDDAGVVDSHLTEETQIQMDVFHQNFYLDLLQRKVKRIFPEYKSQETDCSCAAYRLKRIWIKKFWNCFTNLPSFIYKILKNVKKENFQKKIV